MNEEYLTLAIENDFPKEVIVNYALRECRKERLELDVMGKLVESYIDCIGWLDKEKGISPIISMNTLNELNIYYKDVQCPWRNKDEYLGKKYKIKSVYEDDTLVSVQLVGLKVSYDNFSEGLLNAISESYKIATSNPRSNEKLIPLHGFIARTLQSALGDKYEVKSLGIGDNKEQIVQGSDNAKKVDICVLKNGSPVACLGIKFPCTNYSQNAVNYFENMKGETENLQSKGIPYTQVIFLPEYVPYFKCDGTLVKVEDINDANIKNYLTLSEGRGTRMVCPSIMSVIPISFGNRAFLETNKDRQISPQELAESACLRYSNIDQLERLEPIHRQFLRENSSLVNHLEGLIAYVKSLG